MPNPPQKDPQAMSGWLVLWEAIKVVAISLAIIIPVRYLLLQPFYVKGASMEPNYEDHEYLLIDELTYHFRDPKRGEVVVFKYPKDPSQYFIKRVIGLPNENVSISNNKVYINGQGLLEEAYLANTVLTTGSLNISLGPDQYLLLGDNRPASLDSRIFGPVARKYIVGKTWIRAWPFDRLTRFRTPSYTFQNDTLPSYQLINP
ncbi:signal peptidase I [Candidatus Parcubacteria bacterium]|jgi:signal peptidase I|nr:MAG: signal peptidase I [Candidatus Parcubacteria bacterium]